jgi:hypothetical protein
MPFKQSRIAVLRRKGASSKPEAPESCNYQHSRNDGLGSRRSLAPRLPSLPHLAENGPVRHRPRGLRSASRLGVEGRSFRRCSRIAPMADLRRAILEICHTPRLASVNHA